MINFSPFPNLETDRLVLRRIHQDDIRDLFEMRNDVRMHEHTDTKPDTTTAETEAYVVKMNKGIADGRWIIWAIEHKNARKVIGTISIWNIDSEKNSGELGFGILPSYQGQGLMKEALLRVITYGFDDMNLRVIEAYTEENNITSVKLLEGCSFSETKRVDENGYINNMVYRMIVYGLDNRARI